MDVLTLLSFDTSAHGVIVKKSTIPHADDSLDSFASRKTAKRGAVGYYYGALVNGNQTKWRHNTKTYGVAVMLVSTETFRN